jgi:hypothetical protein
MDSVPALGEPRGRDVGAVDFGEKLGFLRDFCGFWFFFWDFMEFKRDFMELKWGFNGI